MNLRTERKAFRNPPRKNRPIPLWRWNDRLDIPRLLRQFDALLEAGMGGAVIYRPADLDESLFTDEEWFEAAAAVMKRARRRGATMGLHEEPHRAAAAPGDLLELCALALRLEDFTLGEEHLGTPLPGDAAAAFLVTHGGPVHGAEARSGGGITLTPDPIRCSPILFEIDPADWLGHRVLLFREERTPGRPNLLDARAAARRLEAVHERHHRHLRRYFGNPIDHWFTEEGAMAPGPAQIPWDPELATLFRDTRGYSLLPHLPALFFDLPGCETTRFHYWTLVAEMFREGYAGPLQRWCDEHRILSSGPFASAHTLREGTRRHGAAMPLHTYQGLPAVQVSMDNPSGPHGSLESLARQIVGIKQAASVSHQLGDGRLTGVASQGGGPGTTLGDLHAAANLQMALGVTALAYPGASYSLRGARKHCGPIIALHQPYWPLAGKHLDAVARTGRLLEQGRHRCEVLLMHPASSLQATYRHPRTREEEKSPGYLFDADLPFETLDKHFALLSKALLDAQIDFDYGDDEHVALNASIDEERVSVGKRTYAIVVLPPHVNLRSGTLALLQDFAMGGGAVLLAGSPPGLIDGRPSEEGIAFANEYAERVTDGIERFDYSHLVRALTRHGARIVEIRDDDENDVPALKVQRRAWEDGELLYLANPTAQALEATIRFHPAVDGHLEEWDPDSGDTSPLRSCSAEKEVELRLHWEAGQARCLLALQGRARTRFRRDLPRLEVARYRPEWQGQRTGPNVLLLETCRIDDRIETHTAGEIRTLLQQRIGSTRGSVTATTEWRFEVSPLLPVTEPCHAAVELGGDPALTLNGEDIPLGEAEWTLDPAIACIALPQLRPGRNLLTLRQTYTDPGDFQSPWIQGPFRVAAEGPGTPLLELDQGPLPMGAWSTLGMPNYAGAVAYTADFEAQPLDTGHHVHLHMPGLSGAAHVHLNGSPVHRILWPPYACDLTEAWKPGPLHLEILIANTLAPLFAPPGPDQPPTPHGLLSPPEIIVTRTQ